MENRGNFLNRIGQARRQRNMAVCVAVVVIGIAVWGWVRPINIIAERPIGMISLLKNDCMQYAETMCNN